MKMESAEGANLLNIQYGVCFGALFSLCFYLKPLVPDTTAAGDRLAEEFQLVVAVPSGSTLPFAILLVYFFLDWTFANFLRTKIEFGLTRVLLWSLAIWSLGAVVLLTKGANDARFVATAVYVFPVSIYQLVEHARGTYGDSLLRFAGLSVSTIFVILSLLALVIAVFISLGWLADNPDASRFLTVLVGAMVLTKTANVAIVWQSLGK